MLNIGYGKSPRLTRFMLAVSCAYGAYLAQVCSAQAGKHESIQNARFSRPALSGSMLAQLVEIGAAGKIPIGVVANSDLLCSKESINISQTYTLEELMTAFQNALPGYVASFQDEVLIIKPASMSTPTQELLKLRIPKFNEPSEEYPLFRDRLFMFIRAVLKPDEGTGLSTLSSSEDELTPKVETVNQDVGSILDDAIKNGKGGWVLHEIGETWIHNPVSSPYELIPYKDNVAWQSSFRCTTHDQSLNR